MIPTEIKIKSATIRLIAPRLIENIIHNYTTIEEEDLLELKEANVKISNGQPYAVLIDSGMMTHITKEARELLASKEFAQNSIAKALLVRSLGHRIVGQFYIRVNKPHVKTELFTDREKAIKWLKKQL